MEKLWTVLANGEDEKDEWSTQIMKVPGGWMWLHWVHSKSLHTTTLESRLIPDPEHKWV